MAKKLIDIENEIKAQAKPFMNYLKIVLDEKIYEFLLSLSQKSKVYIFSGIIRNYFLKIYLVKDVDIIIDGSLEIEDFISKYEHRKNSFGGYKVFIENKTIDLWFLRNTWALTFQGGIDYQLEKYIPYTAFFNFSSIIYSFNESEFFFTEHFVRFLRDKKIDLVYTPNANLPLCIINSIYYSEKFNLKLGSNLKEYIKFLYKKNVGDYKETQMKHFGKVVYSDDMIREKIENLR